MASRDAGKLRTRGKQAHSARLSDWQGKACEDVAQCRNASMYGKAGRQCQQTGWVRQAGRHGMIGRHGNSARQTSTWRRAWKQLRKGMQACRSRKAGKGQCKETTQTGSQAGGWGDTVTYVGTAGQLWQGMKAATWGKVNIEGRQGGG